MNLPELQQRIEDAANRALLESAEMLAIAEEIMGEGMGHQHGAGNLRVPARELSGRDVQAGGSAMSDWKDQAESWQREYSKMVSIRDLLVAELEAAQKLNAKLLEALEDCAKDSFTAADGMSESGKQSYAGKRWTRAQAARRAGRGNSRSLHFRTGIRP